MATFPTITNRERTIIKIPMFQTLTINYGNKVEQRISLDSAVRYKFQITWNSALKSTELASISNFFIARKGAYESFSWVNPEDSVTYTVRFEEDLINITYFHFQLYELNQITLIEVSA